MLTDREATCMSEEKVREDVLLQQIDQLHCLKNQLEQKLRDAEERLQAQDQELRAFRHSQAVVAQEERIHVQDRLEDSGRRKASLECDENMGLVAALQAELATSEAARLEAEGRARRLAESLMHSRAGGYPGGRTAPEPCSRPCSRGGRAPPEPDKHMRHDSLLDKLERPDSGITTRAPTTSPHQFLASPESACTPGIPEVASSKRPASSELARQLGIEQEWQDAVDKSVVGKSAAGPSPQVLADVSLLRESVQQEDVTWCQPRSMPVRKQPSYPTQQDLDRAEEEEELESQRQLSWIPSPPLQPQRESVTFSTPQQPKRRPPPPSLDAAVSRSRSLPSSGRSALGSIVGLGANDPQDSSWLEGKDQLQSARDAAEAAATLSPEEEAIDSEAHLPASYWEAPMSPHATPLPFSPSHSVIPTKSLRGAETPAHAKAIAMRAVGHGTVMERRARAQAKQSECDPLRTVRNIRDRLREEQLSTDRKLLAIIMPTPPLSSRPALGKALERPSWNRHR